MKLTSTSVVEHQNMVARTLSDSALILRHQAWEQKQMVAPGMSYSCTMEMIVAGAVVVGGGICVVGIGCSICCCCVVGCVRARNEGIENNRTRDREEVARQVQPEQLADQGHEQSPEQTVAVAVVQADEPLQFQHLGENSNKLPEYQPYA